MACIGIELGVSEKLIRTDSKTWNSKELAEASESDPLLLYNVFYWHKMRGCFEVTLVQQ